MRNRGGTGLLLATIPLVALAVDPGGWYPFGPSKWLLVSALVPAGAAVLLWRRPLRLAGPAQRLAWLLVAWLCLAAVLGRDPLYAWTGTPERHLGVLTWALCAVALAAGQSLDAARDRAALTWAVTTAGIGVGALATAEALGWEPSVFAVTPGRLTATMGSAAYLGVVSALLLPAVLGTVLDGQLGQRVRWAATIAAALLVVACVGSGARAAWVGLAAAAVVTGVVHRRAMLAVWRRAALVAAGALVVVLATLALSPAGSRVASATDPDAAGGRSRLDEWRVATRVIARHPVVGVGPEGYRVAFAEGVDDAYEQAHGRDPLPDRAHSAPLDIALAGGIPALLLWGSVVLLMLRAAVSALRAGERWVAGLGAAVIAHVAGQLLLFPTAELEPIAWLLAGFVLGATVPARERVLPRPILATLGGVALIAVAAGVLDVAADHQARDAAGGRGAAAVGAALAAVDRRPDEVRLHLLLARALVADDRGTASAIAAVNDGLRVSPDDPIALRQRASLLVQLAAATHLPKDATAARRELLRLVARDPHNATLFLLAGETARLVDDAASAEREFERAELLAPRDPVPCIELALLYLDTGRQAEAVAAARRAVARAPADQRAKDVLTRASAGGG